MTIIKRVGNITFHAANVAFHYKRCDFWSPWETIGVYVTHPKFQGCRYLPEYAKWWKSRFEGFLKDCDNEYVAGSFETLEIWRKMHVSPLSVISPAIRYWTTSEDYRDIMRCLYVRYVGSRNPTHFLMMSLMLRMRHDYYPAALTNLKRTEAARKAIFEANLI